MNFLLFITFCLGANHLCVFQFLLMAPVIKDDPSSLRNPTFLWENERGDVIQSKEAVFGMHVLISFTVLLTLADFIENFRKSI